MTDAVSYRATAAAETFGGGDVRDYVQLMKPRVMSLVIFTGFVGLIAAPGTLHPILALVAMLCIAIGAGAAGALNMAFEADIDARMKRTSRRPLASGRLNRSDALAFGVTLALFSVMAMALWVNITAGVLLAVTILFYVPVYTLWLKRNTPQNIVIGGAAGAFPPMIGWAAVTGTVTPESLVLFGLIFFWTPPHFWALSLFTDTDYARVGIPMLPVAAGRDETKRQILAYSLFLAPLSIAPWAMGFAGALYGIPATLLGLAFAYHGWAVWARPSPGHKAERALFKFSILYLFLIFAFLGADRVWEKLV